MRFKYLLIVFLTVWTLAFWSNCFASAGDASKRHYVVNHIPIKKDGKTQYMSLAQAMKHFKVPGVSFAVIQNNAITWLNAVGYIDSDHTKEVHDNTLFQAGSMSKPITAMTALQLVEKGKLNLDNPVNPILKGWKIPKPNKYKNDPVTLRQLLSMSSGLNVGGYYGYKPGQPLPSLLQTLKGEKPAAGSPVKLINKPGGQYYYSGGGYEVTQLLIRSQTNKPLPIQANKLIFKPLGMKRSNFEQPLDKGLAKNAALATDKNGNSFTYKWRVTPEYGAAGVWSTPHDIAQFVLSIMKAYQDQSSPILTTSMARQALRQQKNTPYGLGFVIQGQGKKRHFMKLGQNAGYQGWLIGFPNTGQGAVVMTNSDNGAKLAQALIYAIAKAYNWPTKGKLKDAWMIK